MVGKIKSDYEFAVADPKIITDLSKTLVYLQFQTVVSSPRGPQRSGKHIHLQVTPAAAMALLLQLQALKKSMNWPDPHGEAHELRVPPAKDRN